MSEITVSTSARNQLVDITGKVQSALDSEGIDEGICHVYVPHTTAAVAINEGADPDVAGDIEKTLERLVPHSASYAHREGNADAHVKSVMVGSSVSVPVRSGRLMLGTWQSVFFCEFDGPRSRRVYVTALGR
jgi:secondary thiamine-phosphate synthase enzyme